MADHGKHQFAKQITTARTTGKKSSKGYKKRSRVTVTERQKALIKAKHFDQQFSPGARGNKDRFRDMITSSPDPTAAIKQIEKHIERHNP